MNTNKLTPNSMEIKVEELEEVMVMEKMSMMIPRKTDQEFILIMILLDSTRAMKETEKEIIEIIEIEKMKEKGGT